MFSDFQSTINNYWRQYKKPIDPVKQRKKNFCPKCGKQGYRVKMDYLGNRHIKYQMCVYNVDFFKCPRCPHIEKLFSRIEGRGEIGTNAGKMYGSK